MNTDTRTLSNPKLFVSYSWSNAEHEDWVVRLATELRESGVDVVLDKWDLREGHDAHAFMERMVSDPEIQKVILVCDRVYASKTDKRTGGVGKEAQIITGEIYERQQQDKFVAVVRERDENGKPYLPTYYKSRIFIDLSHDETFSENFEQLLRWVYDQPLHQKPQLGAKPMFLATEAEGAVLLGTSSRFKRALTGIRDGRSYAIPATKEYFDTLSDEFEKFRLTGTEDPFDEAVCRSIEAFLPYRNEAIQIFDNLSSHADNEQSSGVLHGFFESISKYLYRPESATQYRDWDWDNFKFFANELFLYAVANLIRHERFAGVDSLAASYYYVPLLSREGRDSMVPYDQFSQGMKSLFFRNDRLKLQRLSLRADFLKQRCSHLSVEFRYLMQADLILFLRSRLEANRTTFWFPNTLVFEHFGPFELFARARSKRHFDKIKILLGIKEKKELGTLLEGFNGNDRYFPRWEYRSFNPAALVGFDELATQA